MDDNICRNHSCPCYQMKMLILFSGIIMLFALLTACGRQENKKVEEKSETQEEDSEWTGLNSPERAQEILDAGNNPNGEGSFHVHSASSYIASGTYEAADGKVILTDEFSDEPQDIYTFEIADDKLIFLADESAEVWDYGPGTAADGMVFVYNEEETEWYMADDLD